MNERHRYAIDVQLDGNIPSIARSLAYYIDECRKDGIVPCTDPAIRLIVYRLASLVGENRDDGAARAG